MNLFIIGGSGKTGLELIQQGIEQGHFITALIRNPNKFKLNHPNLRIVQGDVLAPESYEKHMKEQDAVLSTLGHKRFLFHKSVLSRGTHHLMNAMNQHHVKRFICVTSLGINDSKFRLGLYYTLFTIPFILLFYFHDKSIQEQLIMKSNLDWTIIRPGQLTNGKKTNSYRHGLKIGSYILTKFASRANLADFMLSQLNTDQYLKKAVGIVNR